MELQIDDTHLAPAYVESVLVRKVFKDSKCPEYKR